MIMQLSNLIAPIKGASLNGADLPIAGLTADSRQVQKDFLFVAVPGTQQDGRSFISDALARGATALLSETGSELPALPAGVAFIGVPNVREALSTLAAHFYPRQPAWIAAVTGTSGKTSTVQFARQLWSKAGHAAASLGTLGIIAPGINRYGSLTTPDPVTLHKTIDEVAGAGVTHLAMEASSHGIELNRLDHVAIKSAAFTNLSRDHLDYHKTMEAYLAAKLRLFEVLLNPGSPVVLNADIPEFEKIKAVCEARDHQIISFGHDGKDLTLLAHCPAPHGQELRFELMGRPYEMDLPLIGEFQIWNALCALCLAVASGEDPDKMVEAMTTLEGVPGRLELIGKTSSGGTVFVDYAHKPAALENVLSTLRPHVSATPNAKLHVVFGCGGNRDKGKRPLMGEIAQRLADKVIVTDDNPRKEEAPTIRKEILAGCQAGPNLREIGSRAEAIETAIESLDWGDVLVIAGKGHEEGQIVGDTILPFNDAKVAREAIGKTNA